MNTFTDYSPAIAQDIKGDLTEALEEKISVKELCEMTEEQLICEVYDELATVLDNKVIYYHECFKIIERLGITDWSHYEEENGGSINNICTLAFCALREFCCEHGIVQEVVEVFIGDDAKSD